MNHYLKIFDFHISSKSTSTNTTLFDLAVDHPDLINNISQGNDQTESIQRQLVFNSFKLKLSSDLTNERLKNTTTKKIVKKSKYVQDGQIRTRELLDDYNNKIIYGILHGGKITNNAFLESPIDDYDNYEYSLLHGDRIYDEFFFLVHLSFRTNIARLFILSSSSNTNIDAVVKKYFQTNMFKTPNNERTKVSSYVPYEYRDEVLNRVTVNSITISKLDTVISEDDGIEYEVQIKLKPKSTNSFSIFNGDKIQRIRRSKVVFESDETNDMNSDIKFSIKDPNTSSSKTIAFGQENEFIPRIVLTDEEVYNNSTQIDVDSLKSLCLEYIKYNDTILE